MLKENGKFAFLRGLKIGQDSCFGRLKKTALALKWKTLKSRGSILDNNGRTPLMKKIILKEDKQSKP